MMQWLDNNPLVEFQPEDVITDPKVIGSNDRMIAILPARKIDLTGNVALHTQGECNCRSGKCAGTFYGRSTVEKSGQFSAFPVVTVKACRILSCPLIICLFSLPIVNQWIW